MKETAPLIGSMSVVSTARISPLENEKMAVPHEPRTFHERHDQSEERYEIPVSRLRKIFLGMNNMIDEWEADY